MHSAAPPLIGLLAAAALLLGGCASFAFPDYEPSPDQAALAALRAAWPADHGADGGAVRLVQRAIIERDGSESTLTLYTLLEPGRSLRVHAMSDMGGTVFDVEWSSGAGARVHRVASRFPEALAVRLVADQALVLLPSLDGARVVRTAEGERGLLREAGRRRELRYGDASGGEVVAADGRMWCSARAEGWRTDAAGRPLYPERLRIDAGGPAYRAWVDVVQARPLDAEGR